MSEHTQGAVEAAQIIIRGKKRIHTEYGFKTVRGLAALIDRKTGAAVLLDLCRESLAHPGVFAESGGPLLEKIRAAVAEQKITPAA